MIKRTNQKLLQPETFLEELNVNTRLTDIFRDVFEDPNLELTDDLTREECPEWDSLAHVKLILALQEEYGIQFSFDQVANVKSVRELKQIISNG
jgi:acyl carrier protein